MSKTYTTSNIVDVRNGWLIYQTTVENGEHVGFYVYGSKTSSSDHPFPPFDPTDDRTKVHALGTFFTGAQLQKARDDVNTEIDGREG